MRSNTGCTIIPKKLKEGLSSSGIPQHQSISTTIHSRFGSHRQAGESESTVDVDFPMHQTKVGILSMDAWPA